MALRVAYEKYKKVILSYLSATYKRARESPGIFIGLGILLYPEIISQIQNKLKVQYTTRQQAPQKINIE